MVKSGAHSFMTHQVLIPRASGVFDLLSKAVLIESRYYTQ